MALTSECEVHGWSWDPADDMGCPVCHGIAEEQERIIKLLEENDHYSIDWLIELIKGENK
jgi:hypothetical protein